jgi:hypothetical protein
LLDRKLALIGLGVLGVAAVAVALAMHQEEVKKAVDEIRKAYRPAVN